MSYVPSPRALFFQALSEQWNYEAQYNAACNFYAETGRASWDLEWMRVRGLRDGGFLLAFAPFHEEVIK